MGLHDEVLAQCQAALPGWQGFSVEDFTFADPKGFSSFTMAICARPELERKPKPEAVLYRRLEGKENAILDFEQEKLVFLLLGQRGIAAPCYHYDRDYRLETFYQGRTLTAADLSDTAILTGIGNALYRLHQLQPKGLPQESFFERLHGYWGPMARHVLEDQVDCFPPEERALCEDLRAIYSADTLEKVMRMVPEGPRTFCHNDTYHGNVMQLTSGEVKLLDFEFSCLGHISFDFANLFAETAMRHGLSHPPYFAIAEPTFTPVDVRTLIGAYLDNASLTTQARVRRERELMEQTLASIPLSDFMYAMAALPLSVEPIQKIRFLPYASQRFKRFLNAYHQRFSS